MSEEILDLKEFLERVQDDKELLLELFDIFTADFQKKRKLFDAAYKGKNAEEVKNLAHSLKGASGNISAKRLRESFLKLEEMAKNNDFAAMPDILAGLDKDYIDLLARIDSIKKEFAKN